MSVVGFSNQDIIIDQDESYQDDRDGVFVDQISGYEKIPIPNLMNKNSPESTTTTKKSHKKPILPTCKPPKKLGFKKSKWLTNCMT